MPTYRAELGALPATLEPRLTVNVEGIAPDEATARLGSIDQAGRMTQHLLSKANRKRGQVIAFEVLSIEEIAP